jgi:tetratricopeptide (TPR) repeat protein
MNIRDSGVRNATIANFAHPLPGFLYPVFCVFGVWAMKTLALLFLLALPADSQTGAGLNDAIRLYQKGDFKQAVSLLQQLKAKSPDDADVRLWLGKSYLKTRDWDNAVREIEKTTQLQPNNAKNHLWLGRAWGARAEHSFFTSAIKLAGRVKKEFETARDLSPENLDIRFDLLDFYLNAPGIMGGGRDKADAEVQAIAKLDPKKGYIARSQVLLKDKKWDLAKKELIQATIDYPNDADAHKDAAEFLLDRRDFGGALEYARKALALDKESKRTRLIIAAAEIQLRTNLDNSAKALTNLASGPLADDDPPFEEVYYWLGEYYLAKGDKQKAREALTSAIAFNPEYDKAKEKISRLR